MTTVPEVVLAKEAGICYASIAMATDYDCWKEHEEVVSVDRVLKTLKENANKAKSLLLTTIPQIGSMEWSETLHNMKVSIVSICQQTLPRLSAALCSNLHWTLGPSVHVFYTRLDVLYMFSCHLLAY